MTASNVCRWTESRLSRAQPLRVGFLERHAEQRGEKRVDVVRPSVQRGCQRGLQLEPQSCLGLRDAEAQPVTNQRHG